MSIRQKECWECKNPVYTIDGKFAGKLVNGILQPFTNRDGTNKLQEYNDMGGEVAHYTTCTVKQARKAAQQGKIVQQTTENSSTYVPQGYVQQTSQQPPTQQPTAAPPAGKTTENIQDLHDVGLQLTFMRNEMEATTRGVIDIQEKIKTIENDVGIIKQSLEVLMRAAMGEAIQPGSLEKVSQ